MALSKNERICTLYEAGVPYKQIAATVGVTLGRVNSCLYMARKRGRLTGPKRRRGSKTNAEADQLARELFVA